MDVSSLSLFFSQWPTDWILIGAFASFAAFDAMRSGPARAAALVLSLPAALLFMEKLPSALFLGPLAAQFTTPLDQLATFTALTAALYFVIHRLISKYSNGLEPIQALLAGLAATAVLVVVWLQVPSLDVVWVFGDQVQAAFGAGYRFWWLVGSFIALASVRS